METRKNAKLPEGVGKKIVDALKKQNSFEEFRNDNFGYENDNSGSKASHKEVFVGNSASVQDEYQETHFEKAENFETYEYVEEKEDDLEESFISSKTPSQSSYRELPPRESYVPVEVSRSRYSAPSKEPVSMPNTENTESNITYSSNVNVLMRLISQLPSGVTRQTGAQIIRKTMEAMGISMNKVLGEAQQVQEELSRSIKDNMNTIEEYRNNIRILEKEVQKYKTQSDELEDLISLFILSDKDSR